MNTFAALNDISMIPQSPSPYWILAFPKLLPFCFHRGYRSGSGEFYYAGSSCYHQPQVSAYVPLRLWACSLRNVVRY